MKKFLVFLFTILLLLSGCQKEKAVSATSSNTTRDSQVNAVASSSVDSEMQTADKTLKSIAQEIDELASESSSCDDFYEKFTAYFDENKGIKYADALSVIILSKKDEKFTEYSHIFDYYFDGKDAFANQTFTCLNDEDDDTSFKIIEIIDILLGASVSMPIISVPMFAEIVMVLDGISKRNDLNCDEKGDLLQKYVNIWMEENTFSSTARPLALVNEDECPDNVKKTMHYINAVFEEDSALAKMAKECQSRESVSNALINFYKALTSATTDTDDDDTESDE